MRISKITDFLFDYERKVYFLLFILFFIGFAFGTYHSLCGDLNAGSNFTTSNTWVSLLFKESFCLFITFILGFTVIGFPILCLNIVLYGVYCGIYLTGYTATHGLNGIFTSTLLLFPYFFITVTVLILMTFSSIRMSVALFNVFKNGTRFISPKNYSFPHILKYIIFQFLIFFVSVISSYILQPVIYKILWKEIL